ncbi:MAG: helix-turn-helix transcriptional regulator [Deferribacteraceae bacterium]|jgi:DNA-binding CsgD family transcriptional regulator|nr:helix-turn-helix transcriptional regulator [Deferribacteraceae bacterium]
MTFFKEGFAMLNVFVFAEMSLSILYSIAFYIVFGRLHRPKGRWKKLAAYILIFFVYPIAKASWLVIGDNFSNILGILLLLLLGLLCRRDGDRTLPVISAFYMSAMLVMISLTLYFYAFMLPSTFTFLHVFNLAFYTVEFIEAILCVVWAVFYYFVSRKMTANVPFSFSLLIILMPFAAVVIGLVAASNTNHLLQDDGRTMESDLFLYGGLFCTLILIFNMCAYYLYVRLSVAHESMRFAQELSSTPPVWTAEDGLLPLFIEKYQITPREHQVIEILLLGKTDKEIAIELELAVSTVHAHLKRVYKKTGAAGRFALASLVRGS